MNPNNAINERVVSKPKKTTPPKLGYNEFKDMIESTVTDRSDKKHLDKLYKLLKQGFNGSLSSEKIDEVFSLIIKSESYSMLAMKISLDVCCGSNKSDFFRKLMRKNKEEAAKMSNFPTEKIPLFSNVNGTERKRFLENWVLGNFNRVENHLEWSRNAIICLMSEELISDEFDTIRLISHKLIQKNKPSKSATEKNKYALFVQEIGTLFTQKDPSKNKLTHLFSLIRVFETRYEDICREIKLLRVENEDLKESKTTLENQKKGLEKQVEDSIASIDELQELISLKDVMIQKENDKFKSLAEYQQHESARVQAGYKYSISNSLSHEINEAKLSLDGDKPDIEMALSRLNNMQKTLERMTS